MMKLSPTKTHLLMRLANIRPISMPAAIAKAGPGNATTRRALERTGYMTYSGKIEDKGREYVAAIMAGHRTAAEDAAPIVTDASYLAEGDIVLAIDGTEIAPFTVREPHVIAPGLIGFTAEFEGVGPLVGPRAPARSRFTIRPRPMSYGEVCMWFANCGRPAEHRTPHVILGEVFTCDRCHRNATAH